MSNYFKGRYVANTLLVTGENGELIPFNPSGAAVDEEKLFEGQFVHVQTLLIVGNDGNLRPATPDDFGGGGSGPVSVEWSNVTGKPSTFAPATHQHNASDINAGTLDVARIPTLTQTKVTNLTTDLNARIQKSALASITSIADPTTATAEQVATAFNLLLAALKA